jgi:hypothetical protein
VLSVVLASALAPESLHILFLGNSHTAGHDVPGLVRKLWESDRSQSKIVTEFHRSDFLESFASSHTVKKAIQGRKWHAIILQGLKLSGSHKYQYDHSGAVTIGKLAKLNAKHVRFFVEWPRKGWDEAEWIVGEYKPVAKECEIPLVTIGLAWKPILKEFPSAQLWFDDGNHSSLMGAYVAASALYYSLQPGGKGNWHPKAIESKLAERLRAHAEVALSNR